MESEILIDGGGNFSSDATCVFTQPSSHADVSPVSLALGPLADNGGLTDTVALGQGSVAIGAGSCVLPTDRRGEPRLAPCDSGAYEVSPLAPGESCDDDSECSSGHCDGVCKCPSELFTFITSSIDGGPFASSQWPGGTSSQAASPGCGVTIQNPDGDVTTQCLLAAPYAVTAFSGYSSCAGAGGEDADGCSVTACPPGGVGSCCDVRPSCTTGILGTAQAIFSVQCLE